MKDNFANALFDLSGHHALVTGASSGLGRHFALTLAKAGAAVAVGARRADKLAELVDDITATGGPAAAVNLDVGQRASVLAALDRKSVGLGKRVSVRVRRGGGRIIQTKTKERKERTIRVEISRD